jgi:hypothetical protein
MCGGGGGGGGGGGVGVFCIVVCGCARSNGSVCSAPNANAGCGAAGGAGRSSTMGDSENPPDRSLSLNCRRSLLCLIASGSRFLSCLHLCWFAIQCATANGKMRRWASSSP